MIHVQDARALYELLERNRSHVSQWLTWPNDIGTEEDMLKYLRIETKKNAIRSTIQMSIWFRNQAAGMIGFDFIDLQNKLGNMWYWLGEEFEGKGIMSESSKYAVHYAFSNVQLNRIEIRCAPENSKSRRIAINNGFLEEGLFRQAQWINGRCNDLVIYSLLKSDQEHRKEGDTKWLD